MRGVYRGIFIIIRAELVVKQPGGLPLQFRVEKRLSFSLIKTTPSPHTSRSDKGGNIHTSLTTDQSGLDFFKRRPKNSSLCSI